MRVVIIALLVLLGGCKTNPFEEIPERLTQKVLTFEDVVRWGALEKMYLFLKLDPEGPPPTVPPGLDNVRVTGYEIGAPLTPIDPMRWTQTVAIDYVLTDRQVVRQLIDHQIWASDDEGKTWYRANPVPQFR